MSLHRILRQYLALFAFLLSYFATVVLGNIIYASPWGTWLLESAGFNSNVLRFSTSFTFGFWALLFLPLIAATTLVPLLRPLASRWIVAPLASRSTDFRQADYLALLVATQFLVAWALWRAGAFDMSAADALASIEARFALQGGMAFWEKIALHAILPFLAFYATVASLKTGGRFWVIAAIWGILFCTVALLATNMKWPVLIFFAGIVAALFLFSKRHSYLKAMIGAVVLVVFYLAVSSYVFRWAPTYEPSGQTNGATEQVAPAAPTAAPTSEAERLAEASGTLATNSVRNAPFLIAHAINRMALPYGYYYNIFTEQGQICGTLVTQFTPGPKPCTPTYKVYSTIFGADGFEERGTSPAAPHITAYALNGWFGAGLGTLGICVLLAAFAALPLDGRVVSGALATLGAVTGYHLSQIPGEGVIYYDHGLIWPVLLLLLYAVLRFFFGIFATR